MLSLIAFHILRGALWGLIFSLSLAVGLVLGSTWQVLT